MQIEQLARRLLLALGAGLDGDIEKMPDALRYGALQAFAAIEAERRKAELQNREVYPADELYGVTRLRRAVGGVASLRRWAAEVKVRKLQTKELQKARRQAMGSDRARYEGDKPLNDYLERVLTDCWWGVYGREFADGPALLKFARIAANGIGVKLYPSAEYRGRSSLRGQGVVNGVLLAPVPGHQLIELLDGMAGDTGEDVSLNCTPTPHKFDY